jgi:hypothetical protein
MFDWASVADEWVVLLELKKLFDILVPTVLVE